MKQRDILQSLHSSALPALPQSEFQPLKSPLFLAPPNSSGPPTGCNISLQLMAGKALGQQPKMEGQLLPTPLLSALQVTHPTAAPIATVKEPDPLAPSTQVLLGNSHINSWQTLLQNDRLQKPPIKAWS